METVSVIIPVYNVEDYLDECVGSVIKQTYRDLEIIIVDDGSTDNSLQLCEKWKRVDGRIQIIHKSNGGLSSARNVGLDVATGKYIYFLDSDDYIEQKLIETVVLEMEQGYDLVAFCFDEILSDGRMGNINRGIVGEYTFSNEQERTDFICQKFLLHKIGWEAWNRMYLREMIEKYNLRFADNRIIFAEDLYFNLCYLAHCSRITRISNVLYHYRIRSTSIMGQDSQKLNIGRMNELTKEALNHFKCNTDCDELLKKYPIVFFMIIYEVFRKVVHNANGDWKTIRRQIYEDISDKEHFKELVKKTRKFETNLCYILREYYNPIYVKEIINILSYISDGNYLLFWIRNKLLYINKKNDI